MARRRPWASPLRLKAIAPFNIRASLGLASTSRPRTSMARLGQEPHEWRWSAPAHLARRGRLDNHPPVLAAKHLRPTQSPAHGAATHMHTHTHRPTHDAFGRYMRSPSTRPRWRGLALRHPPCDWRARRKDKRWTPEATHPARGKRPTDHLRQIVHNTLAINAVRAPRSVAGAPVPSTTAPSPPAIGHESSEVGHRTRTGQPRPSLQNRISCRRRDRWRYASIPCPITRSKLLARHLASTNLCRTVCATVTSCNAQTMTSTCVPLPLSHTASDYKYAVSSR